MKFFILSLLLFKNLSFANEVFPFEPIIQCTIVKVHLTVDILGFKKFPELYQSINSVPLNSKLIIGGKEFKGLSPKIILKTENTEHIVIEHRKGKLEIELTGKPISRNGRLKESGRLIADITCH